MKTVSLELAKQLKEKGYPQDAGFWYRIDNEDPNAEYALLLNDPFESSRFTWCAAPSADEILDLLPLVLDNHCYLKIFRQTHGKDTVKYWHIAYNEDRHTCGKPSQMAWQFEESLADVAAKMWLYLKKNDLLGVK